MNAHSTDLDPPVRPSLRSLFHVPARRRALGLAAAILLELLLILALLTLNAPERTLDVAPDRLVTFDVGPPEPEAPEPAEAPPEPSETPPVDTPPAPQTSAPVTPPTPRTDAPPPPRAILPSPVPAPLASPPPAPPAPPAAPARRRQPAGPPAPRGGSGSGDSAVVGTAPNGEKLYAAAWYREPSDGELRGYLSTADGPGWALIACKTVADFRVDECAGLAEYPERGGMLRAVLAAAWQFRVRPPRVGGNYEVGAWVRIRIEYSRR